MLKAEDKQYKDEIIEKVTPGDAGWTITFDGGTCFFVSKDSGVEPHVGETARFYGEGFGRPVRGLDINGREVFYRTPEQQEEYHRQQTIKHQNEKKREFARAQSRLDLDYDSLPRSFQKRLDTFRRNNPDFRWDMEAYEMSVCKDAVRIAETLKTEEAIAAFYELSWEQQLERVPGLFEGHSGNSFGAACLLARLYLRDSKLVEIAHGALCSLVGCKDYGCAAAYQPAN